MIYLLIFVLTLLSCLIFDNLGIVALVSNLTQSYKTQLRVMGARDITDEEKQKALMQQISKQVVYLLKLIGSILLFIAPFMLIFLLERYFSNLHSEVLYSLWGILTSVIAVVFYIVVKKQYVKLLKSRKKPS